jgi:hypothetical protein
MGESDNPTDRLLKLSRAMWTDARAGEWARVIELEAERRTLMDGVFRDGMGGATDVQTEAVMREIVDTDKQTMDLLEHCHNEVGRQLRELASRRKARAAYAANSP